MADRSCVALVRDERLLMVRQCYRGAMIWILPGGGIEPGETPEAAAVREAREEVGLEVALVRLLARRPRATGAASYSCYLGRIVGGRVALGHDPELPPERQELREVRWTPLADLRDHPEVAPLLPILATALITPTRPRASAAVLRADGREILMVRHRRQDGTTYWQLPGGGIARGERPEDAAPRELREETGLVGRIGRFLFTTPYKYGLATTFLVEVDPGASVALGADPEGAGAGHRKLADIAWLPVADIRENPEIARLLLVL